MDWSASTLWWVASGALVAAELFSGTFYMLMLALGCAAGGLAALSGMESSAQVITAAVVGAGTTAVWHYRRASSPRSAPVESNRDANLDIGESIHVPAGKAMGWPVSATAAVHGPCSFAARAGPRPANMSSLPCKAIA